MSAFFVFFFQAEDGIRDVAVTGVQTCALPISFILAGAVNTAIVGSNGVLNRVSEDGVLSEWFRQPHKRFGTRSEEHTSELQSRLHLVCRLLLEKKKTIQHPRHPKPILLRAHSAA